jgi:ABC-2 type transport system ATP-binding protein
MAPEDTMESPKSAGAPDSVVATVPYVVETENLTKMYGEFTAVDGLNLKIREGEIFGLLGPNGAGKTTTILMLMGLTEPTEGDVTVCGFDSTHHPLEVKRLVGYLPENVGFYDDLTARQNLRYTTRLNGLPSNVGEPRIEGVLQDVGLFDVADKLVGEFSRGMRQRLGIADVLIKQPKLVILDEPTLGIDPDGVNQVLDLIMRMSREQHITVMLSSHLLHQVQQICTRVAIFVKGHMVVEGTIDDLAKKTMPRGQAVAIELQISPDTPETIAALKRIPGVSAIERAGETILVRANTDITAGVSKAVTDSGAAVVNLRLRGYGLEDIYFKYFREGRQ